MQFSRPIETRHLFFIGYDISTEIDQYNAFAENYTAQNGIVFVNITDITREGIQDPIFIRFRWIASLAIGLF